MKIYSIYKATNILTGKSYIGFTSNLASRKRLHKYNAWKRNSPFYASIRLYGFDQFVWEEIYSSRDKEHTLCVMEDYFINSYNTKYPHGYNMKDGGSGGNLSQVARKKISEKRRGILFSEEHKKNLSLAHIGYKETEEHKKNISKSLKGKLKGRTNKPLSEETKYKISLALKGKPPTNKNGYLQCSCVICKRPVSINHIGRHHKAMH